MNVQHQGLAAGAWQQLSFCEQMANIGSEVERALKWRAKNNSNYSLRALYRALELLDLTVSGCKKHCRLKEMLRVRETLVDFFIGDNLYSSTPQLWRRYFLAFNYAARRQT